MRIHLLFFVILSSNILFSQKNLNIDKRYDPFLQKQNTRTRIDIPEYQYFLSVEAGFLLLTARDVALSVSSDQTTATYSDNYKISSLGSGQFTSRFGFGYYLAHGLFFVGSVGINYALNEQQEIPEMISSESPSDNTISQKSTYSLIPVSLKLGWDLPVADSFVLTPYFSGGYNIPVGDYVVDVSNENDSFNLDFLGGFAFEVGLGLGVNSRNLSISIQPQYVIQSTTVYYDAVSNFNTIVENIINGKAEQQYFSQYFGLSLTARSVF